MESRPVVPLMRCRATGGRLTIVPNDLDMEPGQAIELCRTAHTRLRATVEPITDEQVRSPSRLPGWTIGHVLTHVARNADGHVRRLDGALRGENVPRYPGGPAQRVDEISQGALRPSADIVADLDTAQRRLELVWDRSAAAGWPHAELLGDDHWPTEASPVRRLREVEVHHVDLGLGYEPSDWPEGYVSWELPMLLATVPSRVHRPEDLRALVAWLSGRRPAPPAIQLDPW
jgi:maleylpyruvate isomerase